VALTVGVLTGVTTRRRLRGHADVVVASLAELVPV
jgi:phosphoglycolate phosphatase-like HAD superfamily hydrolase